MKKELLIMLVAMIAIPMAYSQDKPGWAPAKKPIGAPSASPVIGVRGLCPQTWDGRQIDSAKLLNPTISRHEVTIDNTSWRLSFSDKDVGAIQMATYDKAKFEAKFDPSKSNVTEDQSSIKCAYDMFINNKKAGISVSLHDPISNE